MVTTPRRTKPGTPSADEASRVETTATGWRITFPSAEAPPMMTRAERVQLSARVVRELARDPEFASLLAEDLAAARLELPSLPGRAGRRIDWTPSHLVHLLAMFEALRSAGMRAGDAHAKLSQAYGRGLSVASIANALSRARREVDPADLGPELRARVFGDLIEDPEE